ncbi:MAG TPA: PIN domain-containing protein [Terracidiphilus sp.]|nr:PIN domain-containing protein [Terracidiphilus sp.]
MTFLLDVNLLFVLHQPREAYFPIVHRWFSRIRRDRFATCPITQAGMVRTLMQGFPNGDRFQMAEAREALRIFVELPGHEFWPDEPSYLDAALPLFKRMQGYRQITDAYLLGLARHRGGKLATLDKAIPSLAGPELADAVELIA